MLGSYLPRWGKVPEKVPKVPPHAAEALRGKQVSKAVLAKVLIFLFLLSTAYSLLSTSTSALSSQCSGDSIPFGELDRCIQEIGNEISALKPAHERNQQELAQLREELKRITSQIANIRRQVSLLEADILEREADLVVQQQLLEQRIKSFYMRRRQYSPFLVFLASSTATELTRELALRSQAAVEDRRIIESLAAQIIQLSQDKETLEKSQAGLERLQAEVDQRAGFLEGEIAEVESYITSLTTKQEQLLAQKAGGFQTSVGETPPTLEPCSGPPGSANYCDPGFTAFAAFSFGAPHRTGMSQYGAYGRAKQGQSAEQILAAYYQGAQLRKDYPVPSSITVSGYGTIPFEDNYLLGIYEVPESWGDNGGFEALKAQAVAARSYALAVTSGGQGTICPTEACQVYKPQLKSGKWAEAVRATRGWVLVRDGQPATTYYASTAGGYTLSRWGWTGIKDTSGDWPDTAYEKLAGSPWFYKAWYRTRSGATCGRSHPWLTSQETADILNAWHVLYKGGGDTSRISPIDTDCWQGNPYSISELASIGGYTSVSGASVVYGNNGSTLQLTFQTNKGSVTLSGEEFKKAFNLRAPGYIGIKSTLYNLVRTN